MADGVLGGYRLLHSLHTGQDSHVWEVVEVKSGRHFAMKLLLPEKTGYSKIRQSLLHEAQVGKVLAHPNIIKIMHVVADPKNPYFVMEFFPSGSLKLRIDHKQTDFVKEHTPSILKQTATALAYMNASGWVHRDVKPHNILVNSAGEVRIIDFALTQKIQPPSFWSRLLGRRGEIQGTRSYMSPEQIRGEAVDGRADIYSFGASAFEIVAGRPPFRAVSSQDLLTKHLTEKPPSPQIYNPDVTDEFSALLLRTLAKKRDDRPRHFHEILMALKTMRVFKSQKIQQSSNE